jgi:hypothetical protein
MLPAVHFPEPGAAGPKRAGAFRAAGGHAAGQTFRE